MSNIDDFFAVLAQAKAAKTKEEERLKELAEQESRKKVEEAQPYLLDLFTAVVESKKKLEEKKEEEKKKTEPLLNELQTILKNPEKVKQDKKKKEQKLSEKIDDVSALISGLEQKAKELEDKLESSSNTENKIDSVSKEKLTELEKKFLDLFKSLHDDLNNLKKYVNTLPKTSSTYYGIGGGSGEVNLRYLDDVDRNSIADGRILSYDELSKKFKFIPKPQVNESVNLITGAVDLLGKQMLITLSAISLAQLISYEVRNSSGKEVAVIINKINGSDLELLSLVDMTGLTLYYVGL